MRNSGRQYSDTGEDVAEMIIFGHVLHFGAGISDSDEAISSFLLA